MNNDAAKAWHVLHLKWIQKVVLVERLCFESPPYGIGGSVSSVEV